MTPNTNDESGSMLLSLVAGIAVAMKLKPKDVAELFADQEKSTAWLIDFTLETTKLKMADLMKKKAKK